MKIVASSDWRDAIAFDTPVIVADLVPGEPTRCFGCGPASEPLPRTELWAVKRHHPNDHGGHVRFYCDEHVPKIERPVEPVAAPTRARASAPRAPRAERAPAVRRPTAPEDRVRAMCPNCFVEVSATGSCGMCGHQI